MAETSVRDPFAHLKPLTSNRDLRTSPLLSTKVDVPSIVGFSDAVSFSIEDKRISTLPQTSPGSSKSMNLRSLHTVNTSQRITLSHIRL